MGHYNFRQDLAEAQRTEDEVAERIIARVPGSKLLDKNHNHLYDLAMLIVGRPFYIEVKDDLMSVDTGNIALEYKSRGKWSDIAVTRADAWAFKYRRKADETPRYRLVKTDVLREAWRSGEYHKVVGGDSGSDTRMVLIPVPTFEQWGVTL
jgi:hypothetical protein